MSRAPFLSTPVYRAWMWGGRNLGPILRRRLPWEGPVAESWEVSDVDGSPTGIESGPYAGKKTLRELVRDDGEALLGASANDLRSPRRRFPLLVKYLDARDVLSVQVHPDDAYAARHERGASGKTEMWLVIAAEKGAEVIAGLLPGVGRDDLEAAIREDRVPELLKRHPVRAGDVILIPAGRVHALDKGIVALEIQQTSTLTYRMYDWGRVGPDGKRRELHREKALEVTDFRDAAEPKLNPVARRQAWGTRKLLAVTPYFLTESWDAAGPFAASRALDTETSGHSPDVLMLLDGHARLAWDEGVLDIPYGRTAVIPAATGAYRVEFIEPSHLVRSRVPRFADGLGTWQPIDEDEERRIRAVCDRSAAERLFAGK